MIENILTFGKSLRDFEDLSGRDVFPNAHAHPSFFNQHLNHPSRRLKLFAEDPHANIRAFYFQYLILCFEVENNNTDFYMGKLHEFLLDPNFTFVFLESDDEAIFNDLQFKRLFFEFLKVLQAGEFASVEEALNRYPIADVVFVYFFRTILIYAQVTNDYDEYIDKEEAFQFLLQTFSIDAAIYEEKCLKFFETQVFVYEENPQEVYMAYIEADSHPLNSFEEEEKSIQKTFPPQISQKQQKQLQQSFHQQQQQKLPQENQEERPEEQPTEALEIPTQKETNLEKTNYRTSIATTAIYGKSSPMIPPTEEEQFFYEPKYVEEGLKVYNNYQKIIMRQLDVSNEFTNSLLLRKVSEPYRSNIQHIKRRSREYRSSLIKIFK